MGTALALAAVLAAAPTSRLMAATKCPTLAPRGAAAVASLTLARPLARRDTVIDVLVCLRPTHRGSRIGSLHGELQYDSAMARVLRIERLAGGAQVENAALPGRIRFAVAAPSGTRASGEVLRVQLRVARRGVVPWIDLAMLEVNDVGGAVLTSRTRVSGLAGAPARPAWARADEDEGEHAADRNDARVVPKLARLSPDHIVLRGDGAVQTIEITGTGFDADRNDVLVGGTVLRDVRSAAHGTLIRITMPVSTSSGGEAPPMPMHAGEYAVRVRTAAGSSNTLTLVVAGPPGIR